MDELEKVSLAAYEAQNSRLVRVVKYMAFGWAISVIALGLVLVLSLSYNEEVVTETQTVTQDGGDYGSNHYIGGDINGEANYYPSNNDTASEPGSSSASN